MVYVLLILLLLCIIYFYKSNNQEHFQWDPLWVGNTSLECDGETPRDCLNYSNCGLCDGKCKSGDENGPFFHTGCRQWTYTNYYDRNIFDEKVTRTTPSWDQMYPGYESRLPDPISRSHLE